MLLLHAFFALLYFYNVSSYSAIQPQVCNKLSVQCSVYLIRQKNVVVDNPTVLWRPLPEEPQRMYAYTIYF